MSWRFANFHQHCPFRFCANTYRTPLRRFTSLSQTSWRFAILHQKCALRTLYSHYHSKSLKRLKSLYKMSWRFLIFHQHCLCRTRHSDYHRKSNTQITTESHLNGSNNDRKQADVWRFYISTALLDLVLENYHRKSLQRLKFISQMRWLLQLNISTTLRELVLQVTTEIDFNVWNHHHRKWADVLRFYYSTASLKLFTQITLEIH